MARDGRVLLISDAAGVAHGRRAAPGGRWRCRRPIRSWRRSSTPRRCSCSPTTPRSSRAPTSTSRATSRSPSPSNDPGGHVSRRSARRPPRRGRPRPRPPRWRPTTRRRAATSASPTPRIDALVADWRAGASVPERVALARGLWASDVHEARIAAAKLLTQARIRAHEETVWRAFLDWVPDFDAWAIADHACKVDRAPTRRIAPSGSMSVEAWTRDPSMWVRRAALVATLPWSQARPIPRRPRPPPASASSAGRPATSPTATGSSRRPSAGGCAASRCTTRTASAPSSKAPAPASRPSPAARRRVTSDARDPACGQPRRRSGCETILSGGKRDLA